MNDRDIEDTRMPPDEREAFTCALCGSWPDLTGLEVVINGKRICDSCACEVSSQAGYFDKMLKAEREVKIFKHELNKLHCDCNAQHAFMANIAHSEFCPQGIGEYVLFSVSTKIKDKT
jgi:hypothetical protein